MIKFNDDWKTQHLTTIQSFLKELNSKYSDFYLKGGTSLMLCYNLDRFSEDIDLDSRNKNIKKFVDEYCASHHFSYRTAKDTDLVKRFMIYYAERSKPLKVEISYRKKTIAKDEVTKINGINVYNINQLAIMKANAYTGRDKIRDFYDICFICNNYWNDLDTNVKAIVRIALEYKGLEQYEFIIKDQQDELINNDKLLEDFLTVCDKLDLLTEDIDDLQQMIDQSDEEKNIDEVEYDDIELY